MIIVQIEKRGRSGESPHETSISPKILGDKRGLTRYVARLIILAFRILQPSKKLIFYKGERMKKFFILIILVLVVFSVSYADEKKIPEKENGLILLPAIYSTPETSLVLGL